MSYKMFLTKSNLVVLQPSELSMKGFIESDYCAFISIKDSHITKNDIIKKLESHRKEIFYVALALDEESNQLFITNNDEADYGFLYAYYDDFNYFGVIFSEFDKLDKMRTTIFNEFVDLVDKCNYQLNNPRYDAFVYNFGMQIVEVVSDIYGIEYMFEDEENDAYKRDFPFEFEALLYDRCSSVFTLSKLDSRTIKEMEVTDEHILESLKELYSYDDLDALISISFNEELEEIFMKDNIIEEFLDACKLKPELKRHWNDTIRYNVLRPIKKFIIDEEE